MNKMQMETLLQQSHRIAVVGISDKPHRDSYRVAAYLQAHGYQIVPVNPRLNEVLGEVCYPDLRSIPEPVDIVDVFRRPEETPPIAEEAVAIGAKCLWLQLGVQNEEAEAIAAAGGLTVVSNLCLKVEHTRAGLGTYQG